MPIYEYQCQDCGHKLEVMQRLTEGPLKTCPSCAEEGLKKLISKVGFQLKGTGWYETDFKDKGKPKAKNDGDGDAGKDSTKDTTKPSKSESGKDASSHAKKSDGGGSDKAPTSTATD
jgi:putative FmdB family regulatory protein